MIFNANAINKSEPTDTISVTTASDRMGANTWAINMMHPSTITTGIEEKATPTPNEEANNSAVIPSKIDFV